MTRFATRERNALLLYNGRFNEKHDFIALEIIEEQVQLTFSAGEDGGGQFGLIVLVVESFPLKAHNFISTHLTRKTFGIRKALIQYIMGSVNSSLKT